MAAKKPTREALDAAMVRLMKAYGHRENVTGVDVGYKWTEGKETGQQCLRIHVDRKIPVVELQDNIAFPREFEGLPLDVIEGNYKANRTAEPKDNRDRMPVLMGGITCGRPDGGAGTIAAIVIEERTGRPCLLSNWHVLVGANGTPGDPIMQPALLDGGDPRDGIATLGASLLSEHGDAALAPLNGARPWFPTIFGDFRQLNGIRNSRLGETLTKSGRTTGLTNGKVDGEGIYLVQYEVRPGQFERRPIRGFKLVPERPGNPGNAEISAPGDSGALWYNGNSGDAVGLHFAGETSTQPEAEFALACNMTAVAGKLGFRLAEFDDIPAPAPMAQSMQPEYTPQPEWLPPTWPPGAGWPHPPYPIPQPGAPGPYPVNRRAQFSAPRHAPPHGLPASGHALPAFGVRARTARTKAQYVSVQNFIWPELINALLNKGYIDAQSYSPGTSVKVISEINPAEALAEIVNEHPPFATRQDLDDRSFLPGIYPTSGDFAPVADLNGVVGVLIDQYREQGVYPS